MRHVAAMAAMLLGHISALGQTGASDPELQISPQPDNEAEPDPTEPEITEELYEPQWSLSLAVYSYSVPDGEDYIQPTLTADRDWLHLEGRYNYEAQDTGSAWIGYNFAGAGGSGGELSWALTPMIGGVFGDTTGIAPGYRALLGWRRLELYTEGEYVFDADDDDDSFFYSWTELTLAPTDWFRFGAVMQRTRAYESDNDWQPGAVVGFSFDPINVSAYLLNLDEEDPVFTLAIGFTF
jgi:hypothetical protein